MASMILAATVLVISCQVVIGNEGIFTSSADLERLLSTEAELVKALKHYVAQEEKRLLDIKKHILGYEAIQTQSSGNVEKYIGNPLNSFLLIKKLTSDWKEVKGLMTKSTAEATLHSLNDTYERPLKWPSEEDLTGAAIALTRLQDTYNLNPSDMARGQFNGVSLGTVLSAHDCFELGRQHYNSADYEHAIIWMKEALKRLDEEEGKTVDRCDILEYIGFAYYTLGNIKKALVYTNELLAIQPQHPRAKGNKVYYEDALKNEGVLLHDSKAKKGDDGYDDEPEAEFTVNERKLVDNAEGEYVIYKKLCRGEKVTDDAKDTLRCRYNHGKHPYVLLAPYKEEELHLDPKIVLFHDVLSDQEISTIKSFAVPRFKRATVQNYKTGDLETASYRISKTAWIKREEDRDIERIYTRVGDVTGLNMNTSEELQVSNYGIGGHYEPHFDFARREEANAFASLGTGNRIATWLFYVSDVEMGGATVFPDLGLTLWPKKGAAVFWYNLYKNGEGDVRTRHAACPVLSGTKWVSNFWIHERGQETARPCSPNPDQ